MAMIENNLPSFMKMSQRSNFGHERLGMEMMRNASGQSHVRTWSDHNLAKYDLKFEYLKASENGLRDTRAFLDAIEMGGTFWIKEPFSGSHRDMICGPLGDASRTCFPAPIYGSITDGVYMIDGVPQLSGVTMHDTANMLTGGDEYAQPGANNGNVLDWAGAYFTPEIQYNFGLVSASCLKCTPDGTSNPVVVLPVFQQCGAVAAPGDIVSGVVAVFETKSSPRTFNVSIRYYNSSDAFISKDDATPSASTTGEWTIFSHTAGAAPALTAYCVVSIREETNATSDPFFADTFAVCPSTFDRWHLPSMSPNVIEFSSAPAADERVTMGGEGVRLTRCRMERDSMAFTMIKPGHATPSKAKFFEAPEF